jgi:hypothetical protein
MYRLLLPCSGPPCPGMHSLVTPTSATLEVGTKPSGQITGHTCSLFRRTSPACTWSPSSCKWHIPLHLGFRSNSKNPYPLLEVYIALVPQIKRAISLKTVPEEGCFSHSCQTRSSLTHPPKLSFTLCSPAWCTTCLKTQKEKQTRATDIHHSNCFKCWKYTTLRRDPGVTYGLWWGNVYEQWGSNLIQKRNSAGGSLFLWTIVFRAPLFFPLLFDVNLSLLKISKN